MSCTFGREAAAAATLALLGKARFSNKSSPGMLLLEGPSSSPAACPHTKQVRNEQCEDSWGTEFKQRRHTSDADLL